MSKRNNTTNQLTTLTTLKTEFLACHEFNVDIETQADIDTKFDLLYEREEQEIAHADMIGAKQWDIETMD